MSDTRRPSGWNSRWVRFMAVIAAVLAIVMVLACGGKSDSKSGGKDGGSNSSYQPKADDRALVNSADGNCDKDPNLPDETEAWYDCRYALKHGDDRPKDFAKKCSRPDPTSKRCITPRMEYFVKQARRAGFEPTGCNEEREHNSNSQHPLGRACDYGMSKGKATGKAKARGDKFAAWAVEHADENGVMYVIWYRQIWTSDTGHWRHYDALPGTEGTASGEHTDHAHVSVLS